MIANPELIKLSSQPLAAIVAAVKVGAGLSLVSYGIIAPKPALVRGGLVLAGMIVLFI